jgi:hypothetical protein
MVCGRKVASYSEIQANLLRACRQRYGQGYEEEEVSLVKKPEEVSRAKESGEKAAENAKGSTSSLIPNIEVKMLGTFAKISVSELFGLMKS